MAFPTKKPDDMDPSSVFGDMAGDGDAEDQQDGGDDEDTEDGGDSLPPDFVSHAKTALGTDDPGAIQALYDAIEACGGMGGGSGKDDALVIGIGKPKPSMGRG